MAALVLVWGGAALGGGMLAVQCGLREFAPPARTTGPLIRRAVPPATPAPPRPSPESGTFGTVGLPTAAGLETDASVPIASARPFTSSATPVEDRARALQCLTAAIYYEAASESDDGQRAVAQVVLNRVRHPAFPATVCGVVYQGSERTGCQFSFACDGALARAPSAKGWARAARTAAAALRGFVFAPVGLAPHYHTFAVTPAWTRTLVMTGAIGSHLFHRWKGWWGTPAAFSRPYHGGEPTPGPHVLPVPVTETPPMPVASPRRDASEVDGRSAAAAVPAPRDLPESTILDRWKDSGQPLR